MMESKYIVNGSTLEAMAEALQSKLGTSETFTPSQMVMAINDLSPGGGLSYADYVVPMAAYSSSYYAPTEYPEVRAILPNAFYSANVSGALSFPKCEYVGDHAFYGCSQMTSIYMSNCQFIGSGAFNRCSSLQSIDTRFVSYFGPYAFIGCSNLSSMSFASDIQLTFDSYAFEGAGLRNLLIDNESYANAAILNEQAFYACSQLITASINCAMFYGQSTFARCSGLTTVDIGVGYYNAPQSNCFERCTALSDVTIRGLRVAPREMFAYCTSLSRISLPEVSVIYGYAFSMCSSLSEVYLLSTSKVILSSAIAWNNATIYAWSAFYSTPLNSGNGHIYVPSSLYSAYYNDTIWSRFRSVLTSYTQATAV